MCDQLKAGWHFIANVLLECVWLVCTIAHKSTTGKQQVKIPGST